MDSPFGTGHSADTLRLVVELWGHEEFFDPAFQQLLGRAHLISLPYKDQFEVFVRIHFYDSIKR
jgi:hypothetical protein